jgi:HD superfamily phosphodiesterase
VRRWLEATTALAGLVVLALALATQGLASWPFVLAFGALVVLSENTAVLVHRGSTSTSASPGFMIVMAAIAVAHPDGTALAVAAAVGACGGIDRHHLRERRWGILAFNTGQFTLSAAAAGGAYVLADDLPRLVAAAAATGAYGLVNVTLIVNYVALKAGEPRETVWRDMRPALPNYLAFGMVGLVVGLLCAELSALAVLLLGVPMVIGRWTFRSFQRTREAQDATVRLFSRLIEAKDPYTAGHTERVSRYSVLVGTELGLDADDLDHLRLSALMHDVGKLAIPTDLLNKPGRLTPQEWEVVRRHNDAGLAILGQIGFMRTMAVVASDAFGRYEEGTGDTPERLVREAHIVAVADAYDAMTSTRSYRKALSREVAFDELRRNAGSQFDPVCVEALIRTVEGLDEPAEPNPEEHQYAVPPPDVGVGSAGLGDLLDEHAG